MKNDVGKIETIKRSVGTLSEVSFLILLFVL